MRCGAGQFDTAIRLASDHPQSTEGNETSRLRPLITLTLLAVGAAGCTAPQPEPEPSPSGPAAEAVAADYVRMAPSTPSDTSPLLLQKRPLTPADAAIIGPEYATAFDWTAAVPRIDADDADRMGLEGAITAPSGAELFLAHVARPLPRPVGKAGALTPAIQVVVNGQARESSVRFGRDHILIVCVPTGAPVLLKMSDKGRTQTLDLRSGKRGPDANPLFYTRYAMKDFGVRTNIRPPDPGRIDMSGSLALLPWTEEHGWAPAGKAWLHFEGFLYQMLADTDGPVTLDLSRSITVTVGGKTCPASAEKRLLADTPTSTSTPEPLDIAVPAGFRTGTLRLDPEVICHDCHPGTPSSVRITLVAGPVPMAP
ncbi:hypothetical protein [Catellatospora tritici]|uniref:hypothetical protein n=1 Tax=Catellatospora tritici TaxID=2851566 RepID=UPI001C2D56E2|nr:hypothetical protein [Catellatospora tritici]MBV1849965.1 hypothetical protein [Catellatospora tritici]